MRAILQELIGLFVDDGFLAIALVAWCAAIGLLTSAIPALASIAGPILFGGCAAILLASVAMYNRSR